MVPTPRIPNGASSAARSAPMLLAPYTERPRDSAHRISLCHTVGTCSKKPSMMTMTSNPSSTAAQTSPRRTGGSSVAEGSSSAARDRSRLGPTKTTTRSDTCGLLRPPGPRPRRVPGEQGVELQPRHDRLHDRDADLLLREVHAGDGPGAGALDGLQHRAQVAVD